MGLKFSRKTTAGFSKKFTDRFKTSLGPEAEYLIGQENEEIGEERQRLREAEKQLQKAEKLSSEREKAAQEVQNLRTKLDETQAKIDNMGSSLENEAKLRRLKQPKKIFKPILTMQKKKWHLLKS